MYTVFFKKICYFLCLVDIESSSKVFSFFILKRENNVWEVIEFDLKPKTKLLSESGKKVWFEYCFYNNVFIHCLVFHFYI